MYAQRRQRLLVTLDPVSLPLSRPVGELAGTAYLAPVEPVPLIALVHGIIELRVRYLLPVKLGDRVIEGLSPLVVGSVEGVTVSLVSYIELEIGAVENQFLYACIAHTLTFQYHEYV